MLLGRAPLLLHCLHSFWLFSPSFRTAARALSNARNDTHLGTYCDVFRRLETDFPHMFAVAAARGNLDSLTLSGQVGCDRNGDSETDEITMRDWSVPAAEIADFL